MEEEFPKLQSQQGAVEVLRATSGGAGIRPLTPIPIGSQGYCIQELRSSLNSAVLYVRPLQTELELDQVVQVTSETPKVTCIHCGKEVSLPELRVHCQSLECTLARPGTSNDPAFDRRERNEDTALGCASASFGISSPVDLIDDHTVERAERNEDKILQTTEDVPTASVSQCASTTSVAVKLEDLKEMFPNLPLDTLSEVATSSLLKHW